MSVTMEDSIKRKTAKRKMALVFVIVQHPKRSISDWISVYNTRRPHQALDRETPAEAFMQAA